MSEENQKKIMLKVQQVSRAFPVAGGEDFYALKNVSVEIPERTVSILRGRSGSGKTTLLNLMGALDRPTSGEIWLDGTEITKLSEKRREKLRRKRIGFIFQSVSLIPIMTAYENVEFALRLANYRGDHKKRVEEALGMVGLGSRMHHMPQELSGGEQQRVAIARAIAHYPAIIFADEPTAELDTNTSRHVMKIFKDLVAQENITIVMTTHDTGLMGSADVVYELEDGEVVNNHGK